MSYSGEMTGDGFFQDLRKWASHPFSEGTGISALHLWILVGIFILFALSWNILLRHLLEALSEA